MELAPQPSGAAAAPCPNCGSTARTIQAGARGGVKLRGTARGRQIWVWDSLSLTLAGVLYGIVVTVVGVIVAPHGTVPAVIYAGVVLAILLVGLFFFAPSVIAWMRWLLERAKR
jgi:hypothetical protein